ncbi:MAG: hypothetical protein C0490_16580, partial [Marivirga sp.]|nr:hypothetical protein [Marivirga sp.]
MRKIISTAVLLIIGYLLHAQSFEVSGKVNDSENKPLPGINIIVKGTSVGTVTNPEGHFKIVVPYGSHVLVYSFIGYKPVEQKIHVAKDFPWELEVTMV